MTTRVDRSGGPLGGTTRGAHSWGPLGVTILGDHSGATRGDTLGNGPGRKRHKVLTEITVKNLLMLLLLGENEHGFSVAILALGALSSCTRAATPERFASHRDGATCHHHLVGGSRVHLGRDLSPAGRRPLRRTLGLQMLACGTTRKVSS